MFKCFKGDDAVGCKIFRNFRMMRDAIPCHARPESRARLDLTTTECSDQDSKNKEHTFSWAPPLRHPQVYHVLLCSA